MFTRTLEQAQRAPGHFADLAGDLSRVMGFGGRVGFRDRRLVQRRAVRRRHRAAAENADIDTVLAASTLD